MFKRLLIGASSILIAYSLVGDAQAFVIDPFETAQSVVAPPGNTASGHATSKDMAGDERDVVAFAPAGFGVTEVAVNSFGSSDLAYSQGSNGGYALLTWDGVDASIVLDPAGLGGVDLTDGGLADAFALEISFADSDIDLVLTLHSDATDRSEAVLAISASAGPSTVLIAFLDFAPVGGAGARFFDAGAIELRIEGPMGTDFRLGSVYTTALNPIPEPSTLLLTTMGLAGLGVCRRRFQPGLEAPHRCLGATRTQDAGLRRCD